MEVSKGATSVQATSCQRVQEERADTPRCEARGECPGEEELSEGTRWKDRRQGQEHGFLPVTFQTRPSCCNGQVPSLS